MIPYVVILFIYVCMFVCMYVCIDTCLSDGGSGRLMAVIMTFLAVCTPSMNSKTCMRCVHHVRRWTPPTRLE